MACNPNVSTHYDKMAILRSQIYNMPYNEWNVEGLSHQLAMSKSYFQHLYKETFGISVMNDVILSRVEHAKFLLSTTDISITKIAQMCGYKCELHFMRQFKSRMNMTPSEYRISVSKENNFNN
ncbi:MAG: helix-turn-helix transcriptional regulator [Oscillospiraceae bacterium]|nr:helix-turn-helix transcriptional regulator [Oscillospiraceae bacterium]